MATICLIEDCKKKAEKQGIKRSTLDMRIRVYGWAVEKALT